MTLKIYVAKDSKGLEWAPDTPHEVGACEWMVKKAWEEFHHLKELYAILLNLQNPSADMVVIRERGLGILEMKHNYGEIKISRSGVWMAGDTHIIHAGIHLNPREQVRSYTKEIRERIIREILPANLVHRKTFWHHLKFQTAVCFTNDRAILKIAKNQIERWPPELFEPWEDKFSIFKMQEFTSWIRSLRFELKDDPSRDFSPIRLGHERIIEVATRVLDLVEWEEIEKAMPTPRPYGCLILEDAEGRQVFNLVKDRSLVGRSHECDVVLPERYGRVSKKHCYIERKLKSITIQDHPSRNGTYIMDRRIEKPVRLEHGDVIMLGGPSSGHCCKLRFEISEKASHKTGATEIGSVGFDPGI